MLVHSISSNDNLSNIFLVNNMKKNRAYRSIITLNILIIASTFTLFNANYTLAKNSNCANANSNVEYKECQHRAYAAADRRLNQVYQQIISRLTGVEKQKLINAQLAWIKFRDNNCDFETYGTMKGSGYSGFVSECLERMTNSRIKELENWRG
jgi:uncharacterized protein YecT (DUF1311 family)